MQVSKHRRRAPVVARSIATVCAAAVCCAPFALLASCGGKPGPRMAVMRVTHRLTENKAHETEVVVGGEVVNDLPFAAGTGYSWSATGFNSKVLALKSQESKSDADESMPGGPMIEHFVFEGVKPGETTITFELRRPWEKDIAPADTRTMKVKVVASDDDQASSTRMHSFIAVHLDLHEAPQCGWQDEEEQVRRKREELEVARRKRAERPNPTENSSENSILLAERTFRERLSQVTSEEDRNRYRDRLATLDRLSKELQTTEARQDAALAEINTSLAEFDKMQEALADLRRQLGPLLLEASLLQRGLTEGENRSNFALGYELRLELGSLDDMEWVAKGWDPKVVVMRARQDREQSATQLKFFHVFEAVGLGETTVTFELRPIDQIANVDSGVVMPEALGEPPVLTRKITLKVAETAPSDPRMVPARARHRLLMEQPYESTIGVGRELAAELEYGSGRSAGWVLREFDSKLLRLKSKTDWSEAPSGTNGGTMVVRYLFEGLSPGETTLVFEFRAWDDLQYGDPPTVRTDAETKEPMAQHTIRVKVVDTPVKN